MAIFRYAVAFLVALVSADGIGGKPVHLRSLLRVTPFHKLVSHR
jgi:hypothetical protein